MACRVTPKSLESVQRPIHTATGLPNEHYLRDIIGFDHRLWLLFR